MNPIYLFVYGTLRRDGGNETHQLLVNYGEFVGNAVYRGRLYEVDGYPGAVPSDNSNDLVQGEVYWLHQADCVLSLLDRYEEIGPEFSEPNEYCRLKQTVVLDGGSSIMAWVYIYNHSTAGLKRIARFPSEPLTNLLQGNL